MSKVSTTELRPNLVTDSQLKLARSRQALMKAYDEKDWERVRYCDTQLATSMDAVFDDEQRDNRVLINELEKILVAYAKIVAELPESTGAIVSKPGK